MEELLREFCELAPKEWGIGWDTKDRAFIQSGDADLDIDLSNDRASAEAIIFLLDWLEGQGIQSVAYWFDESGGDQKYVCITYMFDADSPRATCYGKTRIEAVLRACVSVLRVQEEEEK